MRKIAFGVVVVLILGLLWLLYVDRAALPFAGAHGPVAYVADNGQPTLVCLGDSLTAGDAAPADQSYPAWLQRRLNAQGYDYRVINAGVSGNRVADGLARLSSDVLAYHPRVVIVELGSNDPGHTASAVWSAQLGTLIGRLQADDVHVILGGLDEPGLKTVYLDLAGRYGVPLVWFTDGLWSRPGLWGDPHHPNGAGYRVVMEAFWPALVRYLGST